MNIKRVPIEQVQNWEDNPRNIKTKDFERLKRQIKELGVYKPMIACPENGGYTILGGNMRLRALKELGIKEVEISIVHPKSEAEKIKYALSDNDRAGEYEEEKLAELVYPYIDEIELGDYKIDVGEPVNLQDVIEDYAPNLDGSEDEVPEIDDSPAITKTGDLFKLGRHRLLCGDATKEEDVNRLMNGEKADLCLTDPPYSVDYETRKEDKNKTKSLRSYVDPKDAKKLLYGFMSIMPTKCLIMTYADKHLHPYIITCEDLKFETIDLLIWKKQNFCFWPGARYQQQHETIFLTRKKGVKFYSNTAPNDSTVFEIKRNLNNKLHPTIRPMELWIKLIKNHTKKDFLIYDPFLGSGTTIIAAEKLGRACYGIEISPYYCDVTIKRYADYTGTPEEEIRETVEHG